MDNPTTRRTPSSSGGTTTASLINRVLGGRYELVERLGEGELVRAFRSRDLSVARVVAVKVLQDDVLLQPGAKEAFFEGLRHLVALNHPRVARIYNIGEEVDVTYYAEEFVRGVDLKERIRRLAPFSPSMATAFADSIAEGLEFLHARGIVHGTLCPQDILVDSDTQIKMTGVGMNRLLQYMCAARPSKFQSVVPYLRPPRGAEPTVASDIYSIGIILYEMLTGELPMPAGEGRFVTPRERNPAVPRALEGVVIKALGAELAGSDTNVVGTRLSAPQYATIKHLRDDLRAVIEAMKFGRPLNWSPLDPPAVSSQPEDIALKPVAIRASVTPRERAVRDAGLYPEARSGTNPVVIESPRQEPRVATASTIESAPGAGEENRRKVPSSTNRWLTFVNLLLALILVGGVGFFFWMAVNFTKPAPEVVVPNLVGKTLGEAEQLSRQLNFTLAKVEEQYRDKEPRNSIFQMRPEPGRRIREGKPVSIWVSKGPRLVLVPDVRDVSFDKARKSIESVGLRIGSYPKEYDALVAKGNVIRQTPDPGEERPRGAKVDLVLSKGEEPPPPPIEDLPTPGTVADTPVTDTAPVPDKAPGDSDETVRIFEARYNVPDDGATHTIRIDVSDRDGTRTVYNKERKPGDVVREDVEGVGKKITILLFDNDIVVKTNYSKGSGNE